MPNFHLFDFNSLFFPKFLYFWLPELRMEFDKVQPLHYQIHDR